MVVASRRDREPDMADHARALGVEHFVDSSRRDVPGIAIAAGAVVAGLLERFIILRPGIRVQKLEVGLAAAPGWRGSARGGCRQAPRGEQAVQESATVIGR